MLAGRRDPSRRVAIGRGSSRAHFLAIIFLAIGFLDSFQFLDRKKSMRLYFSIADRHFFLVGPVCFSNIFFGNRILLYCCLYHRVKENITLQMMYKMLFYLKYS